MTQYTKYLAARERLEALRTGALNGIPEASDNLIEERDMDWKRQLRTDEGELKSMIGRLNVPREGGGLLSLGERETALRSLGEKLSEMRSFVDDCMSGRSDHERAVLEYKIRVEYPIFSHLTSLSTLSHEYVEWSCA